LQLATQHHEATADVANAFTVVAAEVRDGLEVRGEAAGQPHQLYIALAFALQPAAGLDAIEITVQVELQQHRGVIRRPTRCSRLCSIKTRADQVQLVDEDVHDPNGVVVCNEVIQALRQQRDLLPVLTFDVSRHIDLYVQYGCALYRVQHRPIRG